MITVMDSMREPLRKSERSLDPQLWHACAGGMVQMPPVSSSAFYFPQGHAEHANGSVDFGNVPVPPLIPCRVSAIKYMADPETDEVYAKIRLVPQRENEFSYEDDMFSGSNGSENTERSSASFAKTLTQSDANNGGGFSVPRYCAETIFPRLDYSAEPPVQTILVKDVHGEVWKFRHIYRGTPRRHLLTTGWSNFVNQKKLVAGDSIVFLRAENGDLCVGIRRAKRGIGGGLEYQSGWNTGAGNSGSIFGGFSPFVRDGDCKLMRRSSDGDLRGRLRPESIVEAAILAARGHPFEVVYYPRASTPEFVVKASAVRAAMQIQWCSGMRFKMPFETEDSSRISWFMGTISSVQVSDPIRWPNSPWRLLQVTWDEPELLQNVKHVNPWLVEMVSNIPTIHLSPFSPQRKKMRLPQLPDFSLLNQLPVPSFSTNSLSPLCCITDNVPAGIQGARHSQFGSPSDAHFGKLHLSQFPVGFRPLDHAAKACGVPGNSFSSNDENNENVSCLLTVGSPSKNFERKTETKAPHFLLFGQVILTEQQASGSSSADTIGNSSSDGNTEKTAISSDLSGSGLHQNGLLENSSDEGSPRCKGNRQNDLGFVGHCKVFMESDDHAGGRTLDLSLLRSYDELYDKLADMYGVENAEMLSNVLYHDAAGSVKHTGDEPFSEFLKTARRLMILADSGSQNVVGR